MSVVGLRLYLVVADWYKRRVRDEEYNPHACIEDIYDCYLAQAQLTVGSQYLGLVLFLHENRHKNVSVPIFESKHTKKRSVSLLAPWY